MEPRIAAIQRESLNDKVEKRLRGMLTNGTWAPGERLPTESEFARMFGVSRTTIHVALQKLNASGLVITRAGDGTFAKEFSLRSYLNNASDLYVTPEMLDDVYAFRRLVEVECARLACERATPEDLQAMQLSCGVYQEIIRENTEQTGEGLLRRVKADMDFHYSICQASHNSMYLLAMNAALGPIGKHLENIIPSRIARAPTVDFLSDGRTTHQYILDTIKRRDWPACQKAYLIHIDHHMPIDAYQKAMEDIDRLERRRVNRSPQAEPENIVV